MRRGLMRLLPHLCIILSLMFIVFLVIDTMNSAMAFINNDLSKTLLAVLCVLSIIVSVSLAANQRKR